MQARDLPRPGRSLQFRRSGSEAVTSASRAFNPADGTSGGSAGLRTLVSPAANGAAVRHKLMHRCRFTELYRCRHIALDFKSRQRSWKSPSLLLGMVLFDR